MDTHRKLFWICGLLGVIFVSVGALLEDLPLVNAAVGKLINHAIYEVGIAMIVAVILAMTFERRSIAQFQALATVQQNQILEHFQSRVVTHLTDAADQFSERVQQQLTGWVAEFRTAAAQERTEINRDMLQAVYGVGMPKVMKDEMDLHFLKAYFLIRKLTVNLALRTESIAVGAKKEQQYMLLDVALRYEVENLTSQKQLFDPTPRILKLCPSEVASHIRFFLLRIHAPDLNLLFDEQKLAALRSEDELSVHAHIEPIFVPPAAEGVATAVEVRYQTITTSDPGYYLHIFHHHTSGVELNVDASHPLVHVSAQDFSGNPFTTSFRGNPARYNFSWEANRPFLASQGFYIAWGSRFR